MKSLKNGIDIGIPFSVANLLSGGRHINHEGNLDEKGSIVQVYGV